MTDDQEQGDQEPSAGRLAHLYRSPLAQYFRSPLGYGLVGGLLYWAALPWAQSELLSRVLWPLGWIAPVWWVLLVRRKNLDESSERKTESSEEEQSRLKRLFRRPYVQLWLAGFVFWMATVHWLRLPHPATYIGWFALSFYLAFYLPLFVAVSRVAVHRLHVPAIIAAPIVWTALEYVRAYMITGFLMVALGHTQYPWIALIQISDIFGGYGVSFLVMFVAACIAQMVRCDTQTRRITWWPVMPAAVALGATLVYGHWQLLNPTDWRFGSYQSIGPKIALIQGSIDSDFKGDPTRSQRIMEQYEQQTLRALEEAPDVDLIVWPETIYRFASTGYPLLWIDDGKRFPLEDIEAIRQGQLADLRATAAKFGKPLVLGINTIVPPKSPEDTQRLYNSAVLVQPDGYLTGRYDKMHRVLFGEYIPFSDWLPWLKRLTPLENTVEAGEQPAVFDLGDTRLAPSICYETVLPHVIRRQVHDLTYGPPYAEPDILVNVTNDGWFWGSSQLDQHLVCGVFRAIEMRKPLLIAANTGFSAWIDSDGRIVERGPRRDVGHIIAQPRIGPRSSLYVALGDWFPALCLLLSCGVAVVGLVGMMRRT